MTNLVHVSSKGIQSYTTPQPLVDYFGRRFNYNLLVDLAADRNNTRCPTFITESMNSLDLNWKAFIEEAATSDYHHPHAIDLDAALLKAGMPGDAAGWLNPPFKKNNQFAPKCWEEADSGTKFLTLTLSSLGTVWYREYFRDKAMNFILEDRVTFEGQPAPYPKELMLSVWGAGMTGTSWLSFKDHVDVTR